MIDRKAEIEKAARAIENRRFGHESRNLPAEVTALGIELATAAIDPLLDKIEELERLSQWAFLPRPKCDCEQNGGA